MKSVSAKWWIILLNSNVANLLLLSLFGQSSQWRFGSSLSLWASGTLNQRPRGGGGGGFSVHSVSLWTAGPVCPLAWTTHTNHAECSVVSERVSDYIKERWASLWVPARPGQCICVCVCARVWVFDGTSNRADWDYSRTHCSPSLSPSAVQ